MRISGKKAWTLVYSQGRESLGEKERNSLSWSVVSHHAEQDSFYLSFPFFLVGGAPSCSQGLFLVGLRGPYEVQVIESGSAVYNLTCCPISLGSWIGQSFFENKYHRSKMKEVVTWSRTWGVRGQGWPCHRGWDKVYKEEPKGLPSLTTSRMADMVKERLTWVGTRQLVTGRKAFLANTESRWVGYIPCSPNPEQLMVKVLPPPGADRECVRWGRKTLSFPTREW